MSVPLPEVVDVQGQLLRLSILLGRGGEGAVYDISNARDFVAKIYHKPLSAERAAKIQFMSSLTTNAAKNLVAWPSGLILLKGTRQAIGLLVPKVSGRKDIHNLYSPKSRRSEFPRADWRFLIRASTNTARAFAAVHSTGCVIGDVNQGSVLVGQDATVKLIDCESFQVFAHGRRYACEVGVDTFTPPELQGLNLKDAVRTENHDSFGLAVMIFLLLFMGRHPFAGRFLGKGDMPIPKAISEFRFAYGSMRASVQMEKPPGTPSLSTVGDEVAFLFERAFAKQMTAGGRPSPREWIDGLEKLERSLKQCSANPAHWHHLNSQCPWCPMEGASGIQLFPYVYSDDSSAGTDIRSIWAAVESIIHPGSAPTINANPPLPTPEARAIAGSSARANIVALMLAVGIGAVGLFGGLNAPAPLLLVFGALTAFFGARRWLDKSSELHVFRIANDQAAARWSSVLAEWNDKAGSGGFEKKKMELTALKSQYEILPTLRAKKIEDLKKSARRLQLEKFLDSFEIERAKIEGVGNGRKRTLESYGIETAADLLTNKVETVPGFGPKLCGSLYGWRRSLEAKFIFNPNKGLDATDISKVDRAFGAERRRIESQLQQGAGELRQIHARITATRQHMRTQVTAAYEAFLQASANYKAAGG